MHDILSIRLLLTRVSAHGYNFEDRAVYGPTGTEYSLRVWSLRDTNTPLKGRDGGYAERQNGRWWRLSPHMTDGEIVQTALKACLAFEEHEIREKFLFDGVSIFDPHYDLDALVALRKSHGGGLKERSPPAPQERPQEGDL